MSPRAYPFRVLAVSLFAAAAAASGAPVCLAASAACEARAAAKPAGPDASRLKALNHAEAAERWLAREIPAGFALEDAPEFFEAADEVFFNAEENLWIYAYRSAATGKWIGWVAFDVERTGVVHTAAVAGGH